MWAEVPPNKHYEGPKNPRVYESELPTFTSDVRMEKVGQLFGSSAGHATKDEQTKGSGGGGPVEAVFWVNVQGKDEEGEGEGKKVMTQWRIKGEAFVVDGNDIEGTETSGVRTVKSEVGKRMRVVDSGKEGEWSWKREVTNHFGNMSPGMRGKQLLPHDLVVPFLLHLHDDLPISRYLVMPWHMNALCTITLIPLSQKHTFPKPCDFS